MRYVFLLLFLCHFAYASQASCASGLVATSEDVSWREILKTAAKQCKLALIASDDESRAALNASAGGLWVENANLAKLLELASQSLDLAYKINPHSIQLWGVESKIFKIDYIASERVGQTILRSSESISAQELQRQARAQKDDKLTENLIKSNESFNFWQSLSMDLRAILGESAAIAINPNAGLVQISAKPSKLQKVKEYLSELKSRSTQQVEIDLSIIALELDKGSQNGIDWSKFQLSFDGLVDGKDSSISFSKGQAAQVKVGANLHFSLNGLLNFLNLSGQAQVISSPKITALNNQPAIISVGETINYRVFKSSETINSSSTKMQTSYEPRSLFVGMLLNLSAQIGQNKEIMLRINPSLSSLKNKQSSQSLDGIREIAPDTLERKISSVVSAKSGETLILGGLLVSSNELRNSGVPLLSSIPLIGSIFSHNAKRSSRVELIFVITPRVIQND